MDVRRIRCRGRGRPECPHRYLPMGDLPATNLKRPKPQNLTTTPNQSPGTSATPPQYTQIHPPKITIHPIRPEFQKSPKKPRSSVLYLACMTNYTLPKTINRSPTDRPTCTTSPTPTPHQTHPAPSEPATCRRITRPIKDPGPSAGRTWTEMQKKSRSRITTMEIDLTTHRTAGLEKAAQSHTCNPSLPGNFASAGRVPQPRRLASHVALNAKKSKKVGSRQKFFTRLRPTLPDLSLLDPT